MRKGTTLLSNKGYSLPVASKFGAHPGTPKGNRLQAICISPWAMGFRWTPFFDQKGQFFPPLYSWCGAFDPNVHTITNKLKTACVWTGWGLWETQKVILNMSCSNHSIHGEGEPRRRVPQCSLPKLRVDDPPWSKSDPGPSVTVCQGKRAPDDSYPCFYTAHKACDDVYWWCKDSVIEHWMSSQPSSVGTIGRKWVVGNWVHF